MDGPQGRTARGRPRSASADRAIKDAAVEVVGRVGITAATVDAVAKEAGVPRSMVYRRYRGVAEILTAVLEDVFAAQPVPDTGSLRGDLVAALVPSSAALSEPRWMRLAAAFVAGQADDEALRERARLAWEERRRATRVMVARAVARGELLPSVDADLLLDLLTGAVHYRLLVRPVGVDEGTVREAIDLVLDGALHRDTVDRYPPATSRDEEEPCPTRPDPPPADA